MGKRKEFTGTVISDRMQKSIIVRVVRITKHPKYRKSVKIYDKFKAHDEKNDAKVGDTVRIQETRPISKDKRYRLIEITKKAQTISALAE